MGNRYLFTKANNRKKVTKKEATERYKEYLDDIKMGIERDRNRYSLKIIDDGYICWNPDDEIIAKRIICKALEAGADLDAALGLASVDRKTYGRWMANDLKFKADVMFSREFAIYSLIQIVKSEPSTAWKLLKALSKGRFKEEIDAEAMSKVQIIFNVPRPAQNAQIVECFDAREVNSEQKELTEGDKGNGKTDASVQSE